MSDTVIIRRCATLIEAYACLGLLKSNGFLASIDNANYAAQDWSLVPALGGISIRLPTSQFEAAKACIIQAVEQGETELELAFGEYVKPKKYGRIAIWTMILIWFGLFQLAAGFGLWVLDQLIPPEWIPPPNPHGPQAIFYYGGGAPSGFGPINGIVFLMLIAMFTTLESFLTRPQKTAKDPQP